MPTPGFIFNMSGLLVPDHFSLEFAVRPNILTFPKYVTSTSDDVKARPAISLDANENSAGSCLAAGSMVPCCMQDIIDMGNLNRYPSASHKALRQRIAQWRQLKSIDHLCLGSGASDILDLIIRATCTPGRDMLLIAPPTFELYRVCATLHEVRVKECAQELTAEGDFRLPIEEICTTLSTDDRIKVVFLASPGNPTGSLIPLAQIQRILDLKGFRGIVVVDEAYIDFAVASERASALRLLPKYNNLIVVQSLSKYHGLAGIRVGMAIAHPILTGILAKVQMPYKLSSVALSLAYQALSARGLDRARELQRQIMDNRAALIRILADPTLARNGVGHPIGGNAANFVVVPIHARTIEPSGKRDDMRARRIIDRLRDAHGIAVRYVGGQPSCIGCMRITVGTVKEMETLRTALECVLREC